MKGKKSVVIGVACGLICALSVFLYTSNVQAEASAAREEALSRYGGEQIEVCTATRDISPGETININNTTVKLWVADLLPEGAIRSLEDISGQEATSFIVSGEVITQKRFEKSEDSVEVPEGASALSVAAKDVQAIGGSVVSGMRVDVYATGATTTELIVENVLVLSTNVTGSSDGSASVSWITLALENESVQEVISASQKAELYFVLPGDREGEKAQ